MLQVGFRRTNKKAKPPFNRQLGFWFETVCIRPILPTVGFGLSFIYCLNGSRMFPSVHFNLLSIPDHTNCCQLLLYLFGILF
jgi:hypothetical protein